MDPLKVIKKITNEIIQHLDLISFAFPFIKMMVTWAYIAGWEEGRQNNCKRHPVVQMDQYGKIIETYRSIKDASRAVETHRSSIENVCRGKCHSCKGFHWKYIEDTEQIKEIVEGWQNKL